MSKNRLETQNHSELIFLNLWLKLLRWKKLFHSFAALYSQKENKMKTECPVCGVEIDLAKDAVQGELIECSDCGTELEVISVTPPKVQEAPQEEEDWGQ